MDRRAEEEEEDVSQGLLPYVDNDDDFFRRSNLYNNTHKQQTVGLPTTYRPAAAA